MNNNLTVCTYLVHLVAYGTWQQESSKFEEK